MSPEIDWKVQSDHGQEEIVHTPPPKSRRWPPLVIALVIVIGIALGVSYRSIPEPPAPPTPAPIPLPPIAQTIDLEARALATGNLQLFLRQQDPADEDWRQTQTTAFKTWGTPAAGQLYSIIASGTLSLDRAWANVIQYQATQYFQQTRFYQLKSAQWVRIPPVLDDSFWGETQTAHTLHFDLIYRAKDAAATHLLATQFDEFYAQICADLGCAAASPAAGQRFTLVILPAVHTTMVMGETSASVPITYVLPSPNLLGLYFDDLQANRLTRNQIGNITNYGDIENVLLTSIAFAAADTASTPDRWKSAQNGTALVGLIANWEQARYDPGQLGYADTYWRKVLTDTADRPPLDSLWAWPLTDTGSSVTTLYWAEATALIKFIDEQYGAETVVKFLHAIGPATSLQNAIELTGLVYPDFEKDWQAWLKKNFPK